MRGTEAVRLEGEKVGQAWDDAGPGARKTRDALTAQLKSDLLASVDSEPQLAGLSVTMPHKAEVAPRLDRLSPVAAELGGVNTISWAPPPDGPVLVGASTDGGRDGKTGLTSTAFAPS